MELHNLQPGPGAKKNRKRIGRGPSSGHGKTSGHGHKGQQARSGYKRHYGFEGGQMPLHRRLPKRGFTHVKRHEMAVINIDTLCAHFEEGTEVTTDSIIKARLVKAMPGGVKVLARGDAVKKLTLKVNAISPAAKEKLEAAGGTAEVVSMRPVEEAATA